uniref:ATP-dependent DNA helicase n=1 Tax=Panagrellus redivivus TaxID=6233 RepID=A0A7E4VEY3_PANRE
MADTHQPPESAPPTPKKGGRPPKVKGARKCSQATVARLKREKAQWKRQATVEEASQLVAVADQVEDMEVDLVDDGSSLNVEMEALAVSSKEDSRMQSAETGNKPTNMVESAAGNTGSTVYSLSTGTVVNNGKPRDDDLRQQQSRIVQKRKIQKPPIIATPSPVPKKRNMNEHDLLCADESIQRTNQLEASNSVQPSGDAVNNGPSLPSNVEVITSVEPVIPSAAPAMLNDPDDDLSSNSSFTSNDDDIYGSEHSDALEDESVASVEDGDMGMSLDFEVKLQKGHIPDETEETTDFVVDNDPNPVYHHDPDANYELETEELYFELGPACKDKALLFPDPVYRNDIELMAFLTTMALFAVKSAQMWHGIGVLDSMIASVTGFRAHPARNYMRGYNEHPDIIFHPCFSSPMATSIQESRRRVGHWYLMVFFVKTNQVTIYDSLVNPMDPNADVDSSYRARCHDISEYLFEAKYLDMMPEYVKFAPNAYNKQVDGTNCGVHVARIAESIAFTGFTTALHPFHIREECARMLQTCIEIYRDDGCLRAWPATLQSLAFPLPAGNAVPTKTLAPKETTTKPKKKKRPKTKAAAIQDPVPPSTTKSDVPKTPSKPDVRRSSRITTQKLTREIDQLVYDQEQERKGRAAKKNDIAKGRKSADVLPSACHFGGMDKRCFDCDAFLWEREPPNRCCGFGTIPVEPFQQYPTEMEKVFKDPEFLAHIRAFNTMMAMIIVSSNIQRQMDVFLVCGEFKYNVGDILPAKDTVPRYEQNYIYDTDTAVENRLTDAARFGIDPVKYCDKEIVERLEKILRRHHPLAGEYAYAAELYRKQVEVAASEGRDPERYYLVWQPRKPTDQECIPTDGHHIGQYCKPAAQNTVFRLWKSDGNDVPQKSLMIAVDKKGQKREIPYYSAQIDAAAYPLMFIYGEQGWRTEMPKRIPNENTTATSTSAPAPRKAQSAKQTRKPSKKSRKEVNDADGDKTYRNRDQRLLKDEVPRRVTRQSKVSIPASQPAVPKRKKTKGVPLTAASMTPSSIPFPDPSSTTKECDSLPPEDSSLTSPVNSEGDDDVDDSPLTNPYVSMRGFHMARMYDRTDREKLIFHPVTGCRKLTSVYITDIFLRCERQKLDKLEAVQENLERRSDRYQPLRNTLERLKKQDPKLKDKKIGKIIKLSRQLRGSPADMRSRYQNGVAINVRVGKGKSDLFVTFTGNPQWPEIQDNLRKHYNPPEKWTDRPDLVNRVFLLYAKEFLHDVLVVGVLGKVIAYNYSVEHQKRGMPHIHLLIVLSKKDRKRLRKAKGLDDLLSAELPEYPEDDGTEQVRRLRAYRELVEKMYIHHPGRCAEFCGINKKQPHLCNKRYPKPFNETTITNATGYAELKRPNNGRHVPSKLKGKPFPLTNQYVVPHNRYLALKYGCHINVEDVHNIRSIKYIYKYSFKGHDRGFVKAVKALGKGIDPDTIDYNEIALYRSSRVLGAAEADMRLRTGLPITKCSHAVEVLPIHLPAEHNVSFFDGSSEAQLAELVENDGVAEDSAPVSQLTAYFSTVRDECQVPAYLNDPSRACNLKYIKMPEQYTWNKKQGWKRRVVNRKVIGRVVTVYPSNRERYSLRELLSNRAGVKSFEDLRTVNGQIYGSFEKAAYALGLFLDDRHFESTMREAISVLMPNKCRLTFALLIVFSKPENPAAMLQQFLPELINKRPEAMPFAERERRALAHIASILHHHGIVMTDVDLPAVTDAELQRAIADDYADEEYNADIDGNIAYGQLNDEQHRFVDRVFEAVENPDVHRLFFLQGSGGTGKTFVYNTLIRRLRHQGRRVLPVASTGVAAIMLHGGQTVHSAFRLPIDFDELRSLSAQDVRAAIATRIDVLIWDEAPMQNHLIMRTVDNMLRDWTGNKLRPFGGKVVILGGDFKQVLPVIPGGKIHDSYAASLLSCETFVNNFAVYTLTHNMRAQKDPDFASWLYKVGCGEDRTFDTRPGRAGQTVLTLPEQIVSRSKRDAMDFVYPPSVFDPTMPIEEYQTCVEKCAIVTPTNALVDTYNALIVSKLPSQVRRYQATNWLYKTAQTEEDELRPVMPSEVMEVFEENGFASQNLLLKVRSVVMLTRNLCVRSGLCNGTRMIVMDMKEHIIVCRVITGPMSGSIFAVPKVEHVHDDAKDDTFPPFVRLQFPLRPAFAISINKAQGQTLSRVAIMLDSPCFAHGQLYVALSRARCSADVRVFVPDRDFIRDGRTRIAITQNVVYREVIQAVQTNMQQLFATIP